MTSFHLWCLTGLVLVSLNAPLDGKTQRSESPRQPVFSPEAPVAPQLPVVPQMPGMPQAPDAPPDVADVSFPEKQWRREVVRIGSSYTLAADDGVRQVTVIGGDATIKGRVAGDVVIVLGQARVAGSALIDGSLVVVGGTTAIEEGAQLRRDLVIVAGKIDAPAGFAPGGDYTVVGPQVFGDRFGGMFEWLSRGLLWGRFIVPGIGWVWAVLAVFFFVYLVLGLLFERPVREIADTLGTRPFTALVVGFLITLLLGPICVLLAVSVVGIAVIPLVLGSLCAAWVLGKVGVARWIGRSVLGEAERPRVDAIRSFVVGFVVISAAYVIPVLGLVAWTLLSVFAVGGAALSFLAAYRREIPIAPPSSSARADAPAYGAPGVSLSGMTPAFAGTSAGSMSMDALPPVDQPPTVSDVSASVLPMFPRAAFRDRLAAGVLDLILVLITWGLIDPIARGNGVFALMLIYFIGFWTLKGTTVGGIICQLRVVRVDGQPLRFADALVRGLSSIFSLLVVGLGFFWIMRDAERQAWHDRIAGTYVVKVPRNYPL